MIIKIDVDGVIRNINETMCKLYNQLFNEKITVEDIFDYEYIAEDTSLDITVLNDKDEKLEFHIEKEEDENLGLCF